VAVTLGARCAAEVPERVSICPGRTCGFAAEISVGLPTGSFGRLIDREEDRAARPVVLVCLPRAWVSPRQEGRKGVAAMRGRLANTETENERT
jgi:hypothetical protein